MAKRCGRIGVCNKPRANWWKQALGVDWFNHNSGGSDPYSEELQAVIARANTEGYTLPDSTRLVALNSFIEKRKNDGSLALLDFLYITSLNNVLLKDFSSIDYIMPATRMLSETNDPNYDAGGFMGDGVASFLGTSYNTISDAINWSQNSASIGIYVTENSSMGIGLLGYAAVSAGVRMTVSTTTQQRINAGSNTNNPSYSHSGVGYHANNRSDSATINLYTGTTKTDATQTSDAVFNGEITVGRSSTSFANQRWGLLFGGASLTETQHNNIKTDFESFLSEIGL